METPKITKIASTLREVTEFLAREIDSPSKSPPPWNEFEWRIACSVAAMQGVSSLLATGLVWEGPVQWKRFLETQHRHTLQRHLRIDSLLDLIDKKSRSAGVALVALKGVALHRCGIYRAGERPMADIDLLTHESNLRSMTVLLDECEYDLSFTTWRHRLFEWRHKGGWTTDGLGEHVDNPVKIELHTRVCERLPLSETDITKYLSAPDSSAGLNTYRSNVALMMHLLLHATGNMRAHALRLIQLHDIARLAARLEPNDWETLMAMRPNEGGMWWALPPLALTSRYFPAAIPLGVIEILQSQCSWFLNRLTRRQKLTDASWSNIRVYAFPGIQWARTPDEALRFMFSRLWPTRGAQAEIDRFAATEPRAANIPWYGVSQGERILRWLFSRPPRVQTLLSVRAALQQRFDA